MQDQLSGEDISWVRLAGNPLDPRDYVQALFGAADIFDDQVHVIITGFTFYKAGSHCLVISENYQFFS
jgi:hypothetical protein